MKRLLLLILLGCSLNAQADEVTHRRLAEELMGLTQAEGTVRNWRKRFEAQAQEIVDETAQGRRPEQLSEAQRQAVKRFNERGGALLDGALPWSKLKDPLLRVYMDTFTETETLELVAFFKTATGQKMLKGLPALSEGIARTVRAQIDVLRPQLQTVAQDFQNEFARGNAPLAATPSAKPERGTPAAAPLATRLGACINKKTGRACS